ncbi:MAG: hypothetical protein WCK89_09045, partial [bacterium]
ADALAAPPGGLRVGADADGPIVTGVLLADRTRVLDGDVIEPPPLGINQLTVIFGEQLSRVDDTDGLGNVLNPLNWSLYRNGSEIVGGIAAVDFPAVRNGATRKNRATAAPARSCPA